MSSNCLQKYVFSLCKECNNCDSVEDVRSVLSRLFWVVNPDQQVDVACLRIFEEQCKGANSNVPTPHEMRTALISNYYEQFLEKVRM